MFDDLHDPHPPSPDAAVLARVIARAEQRRHRRRAGTVGLATIVLLAGGAAIATASRVAAPDPTVTDRPIEADLTGDEPDDHAPTNVEDPGRSLPEPTSAPADDEEPGTSLPEPTSVPTTVEQTDQIPYLAFGDSVMQGAASTLFNRGIVVDAQLNRQLGDVVPIVRELRDRGLLATTVVVHVGTSGPISPATLDELMDLLGEVPNVVVLTLHADRTWIDANNELLRGLGERPNVTIIDWAALAPTCPGDCFYTDGIHLKPDGRQFYSTTISDVLGLSPDAPETVPSESSELGDPAP